MCGIVGLEIAPPPAESSEYQGHSAGTEMRVRHFWFPPGPLSWLPRLGGQVPALSAHRDQENVPGILIKDDEQRSLSKRHILCKIELKGEALPDSVATSLAA